jgi:hypothetical protein
MRSSVECCSTMATRRAGSRVPGPMGLLCQASSKCWGMVVRHVRRVLGASAPVSARRCWNGLGDLRASPGLFGYVLGHPDRNTVSVAVFLPVTPALRRIRQPEAPTLAARHSAPASSTRLGPS